MPPRVPQARELAFGLKAAEKSFDWIRSGLCQSCVHRELIRTERGSMFLLCRLSRTDRRFPRYPSLPIFRCAGFKEESEASGRESG